MPAFKPDSWQRASKQAEIILSKWFTGQGHVARERARQAAGIIAQIWRDNQVGIFQLQQKHIRHYVNHRLHKLPLEEALHKHHVLHEMLKTLGKDHWRY